jgi:hypothetical protein
MHACRNPLDVSPRPLWLILLWTETVVVVVVATSLGPPRSLHRHPHLFQVPHPTRRHFLLQHLQVAAEQRDFSSFVLNILVCLAKQ